MNRVSLTTLTLLLTLSHQTHAMGWKFFYPIGTALSPSQTTLVKTLHPTRVPVTTTTTTRALPTAPMYTTTYTGTGSGSGSGLGSGSSSSVSHDVPQLPYDVWNHILSLGGERRLFTPLEREHLRRVSRGWKDVLDAPEYGIKLDISGWNPAKINKLKPDKKHTHIAELVRELDCRDSSGIDLQKIVAWFPNIESLDLSCTELEVPENKSECLKALVGLKGLTKLDVSQTRNVFVSLAHYTAHGLWARKPGKHHEPDKSFRWDHPYYMSLIDAGIASVRGLRDLKVRLTDIDGATLETIVVNNPDLEKLDICACANLYRGLYDPHTHLDLDTEGVLAVADLTKLKELSVGFTETDDAAMAAIIRNNSGLEKLDVCFCGNLTAAGFRAIAKLHGLVELNVSGTTIDDATLETIINNNPQLERLSVGSCDSLRGAGFQAIANLKNLRGLDVSDTRIDNVAMAVVIGNNPGLKELDIRACRYLTALGIRTAIASLHGLVELGVGSARINDAGMAVVIGNNPGLEKLDVCFCSNLTAAGFRAIADLHGLVELSMSGTTIDDATLETIVNNNPQLERLDVQRCVNLTKAGLQATKRLTKLKELKVEYVAIVPSAESAEVVAGLNEFVNADYLKSWFGNMIFSLHGYGLVRGGKL